MANLGKELLEVLNQLGIVDKYIDGEREHYYVSLGKSFEVQSDDLAFLEELFETNVFIIIDHGENTLHIFFEHIVEEINQKNENR